MNKTMLTEVPIFLI